ncbi:unnamed protein product [Dicrocoelium dendriticum]|nr:unnamed protein product [Dicrocoelium dendriticum]
MDSKTMNWTKCANPITSVTPSAGQRKPSLSLSGDLEARAAEVLKTSASFIHSFSYHCEIADKQIYLTMARPAFHLSGQLRSDHRRERFSQ